MASTVNGNVGGSGASSAQVQAQNLLTNVITYTAADGSGNYSLSLAAGSYIIRAFSSSVYYHPKQIAVDGAATYSDVNLSPTALSAANAPVQSTNF